jgi:hypothetical protein
MTGLNKTLHEAPLVASSAAIDGQNDELVLWDVSTGTTKRSTLGPLTEAILRDATLLNVAQARLTFGAAAHSTAKIGFSYSAGQVYVGGKTTAGLEQSILSNASADYLDLGAGNWNVRILGGSIQNFAGNFWQGYCPSYDFYNVAADTRFLKISSSGVDFGASIAKFGTDPATDGTFRLSQPVVDTSGYSIFTIRDTVNSADKDLLHVKYSSAAGNKMRYYVGGTGTVADYDSAFIGASVGVYLNSPVVQFAVNGAASAHAVMSSTGLTLYNGKVLTMGDTGTATTGTFRSQNVSSWQALTLNGLANISVIQTDASNRVIA